MIDTDAATHRRIWDVLPWIANGSAGPDQQRDVEVHLVECSDCRDELVWQRQLHDVMNEDDGGGDAPANLARLIARMDAPINPHGLDRLDGIDDEAPVPVQVSPRTSPSTPWRIAVAALLVAQSAGLVVMAYTLQRTTSPDPAAPADYRTLSSADAAAGLATIRFVPAPELSVQSLQGLLDDAGLRIVDSRARSAIYGLAPIGQDRSAASTAQAIALLRGKPGVLLVEPIADQAPPAAR